VRYRKFGKLDFEVSALGFGAMRFPTRVSEGGAGSAGGEVDEKEAIRMLRYAIDQGVNYIDTAYAYHDGKSEVIVGRALKEGYRDKVRLATKSPVWLIKKPEDFDKLLDEQLKRLDTEYVDFYLLHALSSDRWRDIVIKYDLLRRMETVKKEGKIRHIGFSFHDNADAFTEIIDGYEGWEFCQIQYNYLDIENQAGIKGLKYAASKGLGVVIMEPLLGGRLANPPKDIKEIFTGSGKNWSPVDFALKWLWNQPEVSVVLSGMSNMQQVKENLAYADESGIGILSVDDQETIERVRRKYEQRAAIPCTACEYCMPCPNNVNIPRNFEVYNRALMHDDMSGSQRTYRYFMEEDIRAGNCIQCRVCEDKCPQRIAISEWMPKIHNSLK